MAAVKALVELGIQDDHVISQVIDYFANSHDAKDVPVDSVPFERIKNGSVVTKLASLKGVSNQKKIREILQYLATHN